MFVMKLRGFIVFALVMWTPLYLLYILPRTEKTRPCFQNRLFRPGKTSRAIKPYPTAIIACLRGTDRNCSYVSSHIRSQMPHFMDSETFEIQDFDIDHYVITSSESKRQQEVIADHMTNVSQLLVSGLRGDNFFFKAKQFYHFVTILEMTLNSPLACHDDSNVVVFLDDDVTPCSDASSWLMVITRWLQAYPNISAVRSGGGSSGLAMTCETLYRLHRVLSSKPTSEISAIDVMIDEVFSSNSRHYLYFHHYLFNHQEDHRSLIEERFDFQTSELLHFCRSPIQWHVEGRASAHAACGSRLFEPCEGLAGLPEIPEIAPLQGTSSVCDAFEAVATEWLFVLGDAGHSCDHVCAIQTGGRFACRAAGIAAANSAASIRSLSDCAPLLLHHSVAAPAVFNGTCYVRATACLPGSTDGFCAAMEQNVRRVCPCARPKADSRPSLAVRGRRKPHARLSST
jgi:hypothetical protein